MKLSAICLLCAFSAAPAAAGAARIRPGHPRIYLTARDVPALRARCSGPMRDVFADMQGAAWIMKRPAGTDWSDCTNAAYPPFMYLATGRKEYLAKTKEFLTALSRGWPKNQYLTPEWIRAAAMAADWTWNDLTAAERARFGRTLIDMADWVLKNVWRHSDFNNHFVNEHLSVLYVAVLLDGENIAPARVARLKSIGTDYLLKHALPAADEIAGTRIRTIAESTPWNAYRAEVGNTRLAGPCLVGGQAEGFSYNDWGYARPLALTCEMWRVATGQDLFAGSSFFRGQSVWHAYGLRPDTGTLARSEDCSSGFAPGANLKPFMHILAARLNDPLAEWLARKVKWKYVQKGWQEILWRDAKISPKSPAQLRLPPAACFPKLGHVYFRSGWESKDAAFALFQCGPFYAGHQHLDNNTFVIHRSGSLAIDSGTNDYGPHRGNYYCRTIAHNGVLVYDPAEQFSSRAWSARGTGGSNDGGQMRGVGVTRAGQFKPRSPGDVGRIVAFAAGKHAAACVGDATRAYSPKKVRRAVRAFYHLRAGGADGGDDTFIVYDHVVTARAGLKRTWVLHGIDRPRIEGGGFIVARGAGQLVGQVVSPAGPKLTVVGGPGKEYLVAGKNHPPTQKKPDPESGAWRIELPMAERTLVVLTAQAKGATAPPPPKAAPAHGGLTVTLRRGKLEFRILLASGADALPKVEIRRDGKLLETLTLSRKAQ